MSTGEVVVRLANSAPRADKPHGINSRWRHAPGLRSVGVVEFNILGRITAARGAVGDRILVRASGDNCRKKSLLAKPTYNAIRVTYF